MLSVIVPCFNEQENVELFYSEAVKAFKELDCDYELLFVNDGSSDGTY
ncbi:MAG TPA: glycosyltransferase, partial [Clostridiales bacterium]|nr:glycosyltransferase [Clostridiales bacterium]